MMERETEMEAEMETEMEILSLECEIICGEIDVCLHNASFGIWQKLIHSELASSDNSRNGCYCH